MLVNKRKYVLALMSICYRYLGEETLAQQALELVRAETEPIDVAGWGIFIFGHTASVINVIDTTRLELDEEKYPKDWSKFELPPRGLPSSDGLFTEDP
jgi:predicted exporter